MKKILFAGLLALILTPAYAGNPPNECGNHGNNCGGDDGAGTVGGSGGDGGDSSAIGVGIGIGVGGSSVSHGGTGGQGGAGGSGGIGLGGAGGSGGSVVGSGNSANLNSNVAKGGDQSQGQSQSSKNTNVNGQSQSASSDQSQSNQNAVDASSKNDNRSQGNTTTVSFKDERNAPPVYLGGLTATVSCAGSFNAGSSSPGGSGAFGFTWISADCKQVVTGQNMAAIGESRMACEIWKQTDGFKRAAKRNPAIAQMACK